jgi:glycerol-3-phosphate dehydrogenase (NAD(P)+)
MTEKIAVIGGGSWGATLANLLAGNGHDVAVWEFVREVAEHLKKTRSLKVMPHLKLHAAALVTSDLSEALRGRGVVVCAVPSEFTRATFRAVRESKAVSPGAWVVSVSKGIEPDSLKRMSEVIEDELPAVKGRVAVLSGPSHAEEVALGQSTLVVAAGPAELAKATQALFVTDSFRVYTSADTVGVEFGGAVKNVYAVGCGIADGLGLGDNAKAALMTRGLNEMVRLGIAYGGQGITFMGLSGIGDLIVTCASRHSRNRLLGEKIGTGKTLKEALGEMTMVAEGVVTAKSVHQLSKKFGVEVPIIAELYRCLHEGKPARQALRDLLQRPAEDEMSQVQTLFRKSN